MYCNVAIHLDGMVLIFFIAAGMVLYSEVVTKTMFITHQHFGCHSAVLARHQSILFFRRYPPQSGLRLVKKLGGDTAGTPDPN